MYKSFLIKYAEIAIKGKNRYLFEDALVSQINHALKKAEGEFLVRKEQGRIYVDTLSDYDYDEVVEALSETGAGSTELFPCFEFSGGKGEQKGKVFPKAYFGCAEIGGKGRF